MITCSVSEAERIRRVPGIAFVDGLYGRRAQVAGTGQDVLDIARAFRGYGRDRDVLVDEWEWLTPAIIDTALAYYAAFPEEIDVLLGLERAIGDLAARSD